MSRLLRQRVVLDVVFDPTEFSVPESWFWADLADHHDPIVVVSADPPVSWDESDLEETS